VKHIIKLLNLNNLIIDRSKYRDGEFVNKLSYWYIALILLIVLTGCSNGFVEETVVVQTETVETVQAIQESPPTFTGIPPSSTWTPTYTQIPSPTRTATSTPTQNPLKPYTIDSLTARKYGGGNIDIVDVLADNSYFTRYLITYPSEGLTIYGFLNVPKRAEPLFPVVIALHGYIDPDIYTTLDYSTGYADALARTGFLVIHPNLRNYPPSSEGENLFRIGMAIDVLNLIAIIKQHAGVPGILEGANPDAIGIWGHSMGGGISLRVITVTNDIKSAVLYGAMSGDERRNFEAIFRWSGRERGIDELAVPVEELRQFHQYIF
jgi:pimeloyl-ACP methyl ester carboxylesterase